MNRYRKLLLISSLIFGYLIFSGGDCGTNNGDPGPGIVAPPKNVRLLLDVDSSAGSFAEIRWDASDSHSHPEFKGYRVTTYTVNQAGEVLHIFEDIEAGKTGFHVVINIGRDSTLYRSFVTSEMNDGRRSDSAGTVIYSGIFYGGDGSIDEHIPGSPSESGFGWDITTGTGTRYLFVPENAHLIDLHLRASGDTLLYFYSPDLFDQANGKKTILGIAGTGEEVFSITDLTEPAMDSVEVRVDNVYLLKTQEDYYIKIWVRSIVNVIDPFPYKHVIFEYKVQSARGIRVVKQ